MLKVYRPKNTMELRKTKNRLKVTEGRLLKLASQRRAKKSKFVNEKVKTTLKNWYKARNQFEVEKTKFLNDFKRHWEFETNIS